MSDTSPAILPKISLPSDVRKLTSDEQAKLCEEIRSTIIETVSDNGGHLSSNLGVVELSVALMRAFNPPEDNIVWDVGHQVYPYKLLTGRYNDFKSIRTEGGISGFPDKKESVFDSFTSGHASASISSALGASEADFHLGKANHTVAVIGDGALTGGLAYEGLNNAGRLKRNFIVILNDNKMSISKNVGSISRHLAYMRSRPGYINTKNRTEDFLGKTPFIGAGIARFLRWGKRTIKKLLYRSNVFEDMGFRYYGPFDGHNIEQVTEILEGAKLIDRPVLIHVRTYKGKGYRYAENAPGAFHGLSGFDVETGEMNGNMETFSDIFGKKLTELAGRNEKICAITAAMDSGTGLSYFKANFPDRFYDVGIAEEHAVTFAGGLATKGMLPVFAVYSTFLQRAYDEMIHDVSLQNAKIILGIDRCGFVGEDGKTHQGLLDSAYLRTVPNITVYSPAFYDELELQLEHLISHSGFSAIRYPRGTELYKPDYFKVSESAFSVFGDSSADIVIVSYGRLFSVAAQVFEKLRLKGLKVRHIKLNRIIPLDICAAEECLCAKRVFFIEEGTKQGGIGEGFCSSLYQSGFKGEFTLKAVDNIFQPHAPMYRLLEKNDLDFNGIMSSIEDNL